MKIHIFNPEHDIALANHNPYFTAPHAARRLKADLGYLPALWAGDGDYVLVDDVNAAYEHMRHLKCKVGKVIFKTSSDLRKLFHGKEILEELPTIGNSFSFSNFKIEPWGWDNALCHQLQKAGIPSSWLPSIEKLEIIRNISGRHWVSEHLQKGLPGFCDNKFEIPRSADSIEDVLNLFTNHYHSSVVIKEPWSSSGRGVRFVSGEIDMPTLNWISRIIRKQGHIMLEHKYDNKVMDFAAEFYVHSDGTITYEGLSLFHTNKAAYSGNIIASEKDKREMLSKKVSLEYYNLVVSNIIRILEYYLPKVYEGPFGIDMMALGGGILYPCVELNLRRTMGHVALAVTPLQSAPQRLLRISLTDRYHLQLLNTYENIIDNSLA